MQHLQPNTILQGGKYRIERVLGQGGFGITYLARNTVFDIDVAIKEFFMKDENDRDGSSVTMPNTTKQELFHGQMEKFKKEAKRMFAIKNEHIVGVQDLFEENCTAYYVMDFVDGENLAERLKRTGKPMSEQEVRDILPQILDALKSIHDAGIWHLDLKPANIMLTKEGKVKLIDFGASKQLNALKGGATTSTAISYTNGYAPREQMEQNYDKFGPWTDIYALGATLYALLTNRRPPLPTDIDDDSSEDKHKALPMSEIASKEMRSLVLWMMQTNRNQRPHDVESVYFKLNQYIPTKDDENIDESTIVTESNNKNGKTPSTISLSNNKRKRNQKYYIGYSIAFVLLCVGIGIWYYNSGVLKIKPQYKVLSEENKTCELVKSCELVGNLSQKNVACIPDSTYGKYVIPSEVDGYNVISIGDYSFYRTRLTDVTIPPSVKSIGESAFSSCLYLSSISIPEGLEIIPKYAFYRCGSLSNIHLPSTIKCIKDYAFYGNKSLSSIVIPEGVEEISIGVFSDCYSLSKIVLPSTLKRIKDDAFHNNKSLSSILIPESVEEISMKAFYYTSITSLHFPKTIHAIFDRDAYGLVSLDEIYTNSEPNFSRLKTVVSDILNPLAINYRNGDGGAAFHPLTVPSSFNDLPKDAVLYIPKGSKELYVKAGWTKHFSKVIER